jgi:adenosylhomocysteine nucleosidase
VDPETGAVLRAARARGLPFAVLRAVCDPASRDLPPAALAALDPAGGIGLLGVLRALARQPAQLGALFALGRDASAARRSLLRLTML